MTDAEIDIKVLDSMTLEEAMQERNDANFERTVSALEQGINPPMSETDRLRLMVRLDVAIYACH